MATTKAEREVLYRSGTGRVIRVGDVVTVDGLPRKRFEVGSRQPFFEDGLIRVRSSCAKGWLPARDSSLLTGCTRNGRPRTGGSTHEDGHVGPLLRPDVRVFVGTFRGRMAEPTARRMAAGHSSCSTSTTTKRSRILAHVLQLYEGWHGYAEAATTCRSPAVPPPLPRLDGHGYRTPNENGDQ